MRTHSELIERVLSPDLRRRSESFVDGPMTKNWLAEQAFVLAEHVKQLEDQLEALVETVDAADHRKHAGSRAEAWRHLRKARAAAIKVLT